MAEGPRYSPDGRWYWDGLAWQPVSPAPAARPQPYIPSGTLATVAITLIGVALAGYMSVLVNQIVMLAAALGLVGRGARVISALISLPGGLSDASVALVAQSAVSFAMLALQGAFGPPLTVPVRGPVALVAAAALGGSTLLAILALLGGAIAVPMGVSGSPFLHPDGDLQRTPRSDRAPHHAGAAPASGRPGVSGLSMKKAASCGARGLLRTGWRLTCLAPCQPAPSDAA